MNDDFDFSWTPGQKKFFWLRQFINGIVKFSFSVITDDKIPKDEEVTLQFLTEDPEKKEWYLAMEIQEATQFFATIGLLVALEDRGSVRMRYVEKKHPTKGTALRPEYAIGKNSGKKIEQESEESEGYDFDALIPVSGPAPQTYLSNREN